MWSGECFLGGVWLWLGKWRRMDWVKSRSVSERSIGRCQWGEGSLIIKWVEVGVCLCKVGGSWRGQEIKVWVGT